jgi:predicted  nucleic acid-binding Zn-ribbon protein
MAAVPDDHRTSVMESLTNDVLLTLSRLDGSTRKLAQRLAGVPERLKRILARRETLRADLSALKEELESVSSRRRVLEQEAEVLSSKIAGFDSQLLTLRSNDEYQVMVKQIGDSRARRAERENEALELMEREEELGSRVQAEETRIQDEIADTEADEEELESSRAEIERRLEGSAAEREQQLEALAPDVRRLYDRLARGRDGLAVVPVVKDACGGCFSALPPQRINETRLATRLLTCEACGRILVWDGAPGAA